MDDERGSCCDDDEEEDYGDVQHEDLMVLENHSEDGSVCEVMLDEAELCRDPVGKGNCCKHDKKEEPKGALGGSGESNSESERESPVLVGDMGIVTFGDSSSEDTEPEEQEPSEVMLKQDYELPQPSSSRILLANETPEPGVNGVIVATPLPFLGHFTSFGRVRNKVKKPPKIQSRWRLVKIPLRIKQDLPSKPPESTKIIHHLESEWVSPGWVRPPVPVDPKNGRRILYHYPVTGDKDHLCKILKPSGFYQKRRGGGWICRRWTKRPYPRKLINHTQGEWEAAQKRTAEKEASRHKNFDQEFAEVWAGIQGTDGGIMTETRNIVNKDNQQLRDKKREIWEEWDLRVFNYIQRQTGDKINDSKYRPDQVSSRKIALQNKYCAAVRRRNVFLDIIHEDEYDPYEFRDTALTYNDKKLYDPIKHDWIKDKEEKRAMGESVSEKSRTREILRLRDWPEPEYKSSMAGHVTCDDELQDRVHLAPVPEKWVSKDVFWNKRFGSECWHTSFPKGGKRMDVPRPVPDSQAPPPRWKGIRIVWDVECKKHRKLQISELNPRF